MKTSHLVSIITVTFNSEKYVRKTFQSILDQTYKNIEYFVIDGGSTDNTLAIAREYQAKIPQFWIVSEQDSGIYEAMNKGLKRCQGTLVCIINSDDWFENNALELFIAAYESEGNEYTIVIGDTRRVSADGQFLSTVRNSRKKLEDYIEYTMPVSHQSVCVPLCVYRNLTGFFNEKYAILADYDFIYKAFKTPGINFRFL